MIGVVRWMSLAIWLVWLVLYWGAGVGLVTNIRRAFRSSTFFYDRFFLVGLVLLSNVILWSGYWIARRRLADPLPEHLWPLVLVGGLMTLTGAAGTFWCRRQMRASWSAHTQPVPNQPLIESGPYRVVRHPIYAFACLMTTGTVMLFPLWWNVVSGCGMIALYVFKAHYEEAMLENVLSGYRAYCRRVRYRFLPYVW